MLDSLRSRRVGEPAERVEAARRRLTIPRRRSAAGRDASGKGGRDATGLVFADTAALITSRVIVAALGWAGTLLIVRSLSVTAWGQFSFVYGFLALLTVITAAVNGRVAIRGLIDESEPGAFAGSYVVLRGVLGLLGYGVAVAFVALAGYPEIVLLATVVGGLAVILSSLTSGYEIIFQVEQRMGKVATAGVFGQVAQLALTIILAVIGTTIVGFTVPAILGELVMLVWVVRSARPLLRVRHVIQWSHWGTLFKAAVPLAIGQGLLTLYSSVDTVMLSKMDTFKAVGFYGIAYKFSGVVEMIPFALTTAIMALLVRSWPDEPRVFWTAFRRAVVALFIGAVLVVVEFSVFAAPAIRLLYGGRFVASAEAARLVVGAECVGFFTVLAIATLVAQGRNILYPVAGLVGLIANVSLNLALIPLWSFRGAAWATLITEVLVVSTLWFVLLRTRGRAALPATPLLKALGCGALSLATAIGLDAVAPWPLAAAVSTAVFVAAVHFGKVPGPEGLRSLMHEAESASPAASG